MSSSDWNYSQTDLTSALLRVGIERGDTVFLQLSLATLGQPRNCFTTEQINAMVLDTLRGVIGEEGTVLVPTYTFSFCNQELFDIQKTPTKGGPWSESANFLEYFRQLPAVVRSRDPIHSVAGLGPRASQLLNDIPNTCFGEDSVHDRLRRVGGKICMIGLGLDEATFRHHVEESVGVPFRFKKLFTGYIRNEGLAVKSGWVYNVRIISANGFPDGRSLAQKANDSGICHTERVGHGEILAIDSDAYFKLTKKVLEEDAWATARGPAADVVALEAARVNGPRHEIELPHEASAEQMMEALWHLPRDLVSDAYDASLAALGRQVPMTVHEYATGSECWSWIVPEKWTCLEAYLETVDGERIFSYSDNPLHVVSYSLPFDGVVPRDVLLRHLHVHPKIAEAVPFIFKYYERDWGLCCSKRLRDSLTDDSYRVVIKTEFSYSTLKVGEVVIPGKTDETIVLCSHLCHPHQANDDMAGVIVGVEVARELLKRRNLHYTYRYLIVPETIGSVAYLSEHESLVPKIKGGIFLEMLGLDAPHGLQLSFDGNTELDKCFTLAMRQADYHSWTGKFRSVIGNDERQFNAPGVRIPFLSLSRVLPAEAADWPYREYHSSFDTPELVSYDHMRKSRDLVLKMIATLEANRVPRNNFKGEVFCSRYGLHVDWYSNPEGHKALFDIMDHIDGTRSIAEIATSCGVSFDAVKGTLDELETRGLIGYAG